MPYASPRPVTVPMTSHAKSFHDGVPIATRRGKELDVTVHEPGVYRVEVMRWSARAGSLCAGIRPWIYSNPVYVRLG